MKKLGFYLAFLLAAFTARSGVDQSTNASMDFKEVYEAVRANLPELSENDLNHQAAQGLIDRLGPRVSLLNRPQTVAGTNGEALRSEVYDSAYGYLRLRQLDAAGAKNFITAADRLFSSNKLKGVILDLRFASGEDYEAAAKIADRFAGADKELLDWGTGMKTSTAKSNPVVMPVAVLVNNKTIGSPEALAAVLRNTDAGILIGSPTAGQVGIGKEVPLKSGQRLRVVTSPIKLGKDKVIPLKGVTPDIPVEVNAEDEAAYYEDAYKVLAKAATVASNGANDISLAGTNRPPRRRLNEAELVRMLREGVGYETKPSEDDGSRKTIRDPVLARALDLLKGLAVVQQFRSS